MASRTFTDPRTGETFTAELGNWLEKYIPYNIVSDGYRYNNVGWNDHDMPGNVFDAAEYMLQYGWNGTESERESLRAYLDSKAPIPIEDDHLDVFIDDAKLLLRKNNRPIDEINRDVEKTYGGIGKSAYLDYQDSLRENEGLTEEEIAKKHNEYALDEYYRQSYSLDPGTTSGDIYAQLVEVERNAARDNMQLAEAQSQQLAMAQAETIKALADEVRADRMDRLRSGLSESQLANEEMSQMMANVNALNQQTASANLARLQAQQQLNNAQDTAYTAWLEQAQALGQTGAAYYASEVGDIIAQALKLKKNPQLKSGVSSLQGGKN
jgi:hypothetical protein